MGLAGYRHLPFLHGFQQSGLDFGRGPVDFIGQDQVVEERTGLEFKQVLAAGAVKNLGAGDVRRQQIRGELDTGKPRRKIPGQAFDGPCFGEAWKALQQQVAIGQQSK